MIRLGAPVYGDCSSPDKWAATVRNEGWSAAYCPLQNGDDQSLVRAYADAAERAGIVIAEVGVWNNPIDRDETRRRAAIEACKAKLYLAESIGAACCVNIAGSLNPSVWHGPHKDNLSAGTLEIIVAVTREIVDTIKPKRTFYTLEAMPWIYPDSVDSYIEAVKAIDRPGVAVHLDPVNFITNPRTYFSNAAMLEDCFKRLGPLIKSCHAKDICLRQEPVSVMFDEVRPGLGALDYTTFLRNMASLNRDIPLMIEHLPGLIEYRKAGEYIRETAQKAHAALR